MTKQKKYFSGNGGISMVEVIIAASIITVFIGALIGAYTLYLRISLASVDEIKATFLVEEGLEVVRFLAHSDWENIENLDTETEYFLDFNDSDASWSISQSPNLIDGVFERMVVFEDVFRDGDDRIAGSGTLDPGTKRITVSVFWPAGNPQSTRSVTTYLTDI